MLDLLGRPGKESPSDVITRLDRVHIDDPKALEFLGYTLDNLLHPYRSNGFVILCVGTDRSTGDCLGPLIGSRLIEKGLRNCIIYGTLNEPVHATNLREVSQQISCSYPSKMILAVDACLGKSDSVGYINICRGPLRPGTGVNKDLPSIGNYHITGVVNVGGFMEYMVLQNTRLNLVIRMADTIANGISHALNPSYLCK